MRLIASSSQELAQVHRATLRMMIDLADCPACEHHNHIYSYVTPTSWFALLRQHLISKFSSRSRESAWYEVTGAFAHHVMEFNREEKDTYGLEPALSVATVTG